MKGATASPIVTCHQKWPSIHVAGLVMASISGVEEDHDCSSCFAGQKLHRAKKTSFCLSLTGQ